MKVVNYVKKQVKNVTDNHMMAILNGAMGVILVGTGICIGAYIGFGTGIAVGKICYR